MNASLTIKMKIEFAKYQIKFVTAFILKRISHGAVNFILLVGDDKKILGGKGVKKWGGGLKEIGEVIFGFFRKISGRATPFQ